MAPTGELAPPAVYLDETLSINLHFLLMIFLKFAIFLDGNPDIHQQPFTLTLLSTSHLESPIHLNLYANRREETRIPTGNTSTPHRNARARHWWITHISQDLLVVKVLNTA